MASERMPGKTMAPLAGRPSLHHIVARLVTVTALDGVAVATSTNPLDDVIARLGAELDVPVYRGSEHDVLARTMKAARAVGAATIVTVTGDCPLTDPAVVERVVRAYCERRPDYASNRLHGYAFPIGLDVEVFPADLLAAVEREAKEPRDREHVTLFFYEHPERFQLLSVEPEPREHRPNLRLTLDTEADYELISAIYDELYPRDRLFGLSDVLDLLERRPELTHLNDHIAQRKPWRHLSEQ
jgi:spore coat polysaccharide biosynthesis protein SpsF